MSKHFKSYCLQFDDPRIVDIDDCREAVGDWIGEDEECDDSPSGHHEFYAADPERCKHCEGKIGG